MSDYEMCIEMAKVLNAMMWRLTPRERVEVADKVEIEFCRHCGGAYLSCHCLNDE